MNALLDFKKIEKIAKALGDPYRLKIIEAIRKECQWTECSDIVDMLSLSQSTTSHHIKLLVEADLVIPEKYGRKIRYTLNKEVFASFSEYLHGISK